MSSLTDALTAAVLLHQHKSASTHTDVVAAAKAFHDFLVSAPPASDEQGEDALATTKDAAPAAPSRPRGRPPKAETMAKSATVPQKPTAPVSADEVGNAIFQLLAADKRDAAVALLSKFPHVSGEGMAKSKSTLRPQDYGAFVSQAKELLVADGDLS